MAKRVYIGVMPISNPGPFTSTSGWAANQTVTISLNGTALKVLSGQTSSTPGIKTYLTSAIPSGTYVEINYTMRGNVAAGCYLFNGSTSVLGNAYQALSEKTFRTFTLTGTLGSAVDRLFFLMISPSTSSWFEIGSVSISYGVSQKVKNIYIGVNGVARKVKKAYIGVNGVARLFYSSAPDIAALGITYTGNMIDAGIVTMSGKQYRLLTLTSSGTLTVAEPVNAEVWMCGGGTSNYRDCGGGGGFAKQFSAELSGSMAAVIGAGCNTWDGYGGDTTFLSNNTGSAYFNGAAGTGGGRGYYTGSNANTGDGQSKYPFEDSSYFKCHCAGGGGGGFFSNIDAPSILRCYKGGNGGSNGANGGTHSSVTSYTESIGGVGGTYGGGAGGDAGSAGTDATFYGGGAGGDGSYCSSSYPIPSFSIHSGYQGVIYIRIPVEQ